MGKSLIKVSLLGIIVLMFIQSVIAFGVTTHYWEGKELVIAPGDSVETDFVLQNMVGDKDITLQATIVEGAEIAEIIDDSNTYEVPLGSKNVKSHLKISIPKDAPEDSTYNVVVSYKQLAEEGGQMVQMTGAAASSIPILVKEGSKESPIQAGNVTSSLVVLAILIVLMVGYIYWRKRYLNEKKSSK